MTKTIEVLNKGLKLIITCDSVGMFIRLMVNEHGCKWTEGRLMQLFRICRKLTIMPSLVEWLTDERLKAAMKTQGLDSCNMSSEFKRAVKAHVPKSTKRN